MIKAYTVNCVRAFVTQYWIPSIPVINVILGGCASQQIAGRDKKVDLKTFSIQGVELSQNPTALFTETVGERQARVLNLNELKDKIENIGAQFKQYIPSPIITA